MYKRTPYKKRRFARKPRKTARKSVSLAVKKYVKKSIHSNVENKISNYVALNQPVASLSGYSRSLLPQPSQGGTQNGRIGNEIRIVKGIVKGYVNLLPYNAVTNPVPIQKVRIMLLSMKASMATTLDTSALWQWGNSSLPLQSNLEDTLYAVNKDAYVCYYDRQFTLGSPSQSTYTNGLSTHFSNDKFSIPFNIDWGKFVKSRIKYNDGTTPTNRNMFLWIQSVNADGTGSAVQPSEVHIFQETQYEDA